MAACKKRNLASGDGAEIDYREHGNQELLEYQLDAPNFRRPSQLAGPLCLNRMAVVIRALQKLKEFLSVQSTPRTARFDFSRFAEGDRVYISGKRPRISKPLQNGGKFDIPNGFIPHDEIIGGRPGQAFTTNTGKPQRVIFPDLDTYVSSVPRKVTPVYGTYANYIASLFDIHVPPPAPAQDSESPLEILDAGTGHGSATLSLARAIQAANPPLPDVEVGSKISSYADTINLASKDQFPADDDVTEIWQGWRKSRRALVHSVEVSADYSRHAKKVIAGFRRGLYLPHIDFHTANVDEWVDEQVKSRNQGRFLSYVFLDLPGCHRSLQNVAKAMKDEALIAIFVPSITQIGDCVREIQGSALPLRMEKVLELGDGISNGRRWDVRLAYRKAKDPVEVSCKGGTADGDGESPIGQQTDEQHSPFAEPPMSSQLQSSLNSTHARSEPVPRSDAPVMVCRPKVGEMIIGGGFVGLWRRIPSLED